MPQHILFSSFSSSQNIILAAIIVLLCCARSHEPTIASTVHQESSTIFGIYNDEFNSQTLNPRWRWLNENESLWRVSRSQGKLIVNTTPGDMAVNCNNAQNVLFQGMPDYPFEVTTKVEIQLEEDFQQAGIILTDSADGTLDQDNYVKMGLLHSSFDGGQVAAFVTEVEGTTLSDGWAVAQPQENDFAFLKVLYDNPTVTGYYSVDGEQWQEVGAYNLDWSSDAKMGIYAVTGVVAYGDEPSCTPDIDETTAFFDYFRVNAVDTDVDSADTGFRESGSGAEADLNIPLASEIAAADVEPQETAQSESADAYVTQSLDQITFADTCDYNGRTIVDSLKIGDTDYVGAYDIWNNCTDDKIHGVLMLTPDDESVLYILLVAELASADDVSAFDAALTEYMGQTSATERSESRLDNNDNGTTSASSSAIVRTQGLDASPEPAETETIIVVRAELLNLRSGPSTNFEPLRTVSKNAALTVTGQVNDCAWFQVETNDGVLGWVSGRATLVEFTGRCSEIERVSLP